MAVNPTGNTGFKKETEGEAQAKYVDASIPRILDRSGVFTEIIDERIKQQAKYSRYYDDFKSPAEWVYLIKTYAGTALDPDFDGKPTDDYRQRLVKIAALAVAAIEAFDRKEKTDGR